MAKFLFRLIALVLCFELSLAATISTVYANDEKTEEKLPKALDEVRDNVSKYHQFLDALARAKSDETLEPARPKTQKNLWKTMTQYLETEDGNRINLYDNNMEFNIPYISQPYKKAKFEIVEGELHITVGGKKPFKHVIAGIDASDFILDKNFIFIISRDGHLYSIEKASFAKFYGQRPFLVSDVSWWGPAADKPDDYKISLVSDSVEPISERVLRNNGLLPEGDSDEGKALRSYLQEEDIIMFNSKGEAVDIIKRREVFLKFFQDTALYATLAVKENPELFGNKIEAFFDELTTISEESQKYMLDLMKNPEVQRDMVDPEFRAAMASGNLKYTFELYENAKSLKDNIPPQRALFLDEWQGRFDLLQEEIKEKEEWAKRNNTKIKRFFAKTKEAVLDNTAKKLKDLAAKLRTSFTKEGRRKVINRLTDFSTLTGYVAAGVVGDVVTGGMVSQASSWMLDQGVDVWNWVIASVNHLAEAKFPILEYPELTSKTAQVALMMNSAYMLYLGSMAVKGVINKKGFLVSLMSTGMKTFGYLMYPVLHGLAAATNQKNFIPAIQAGLEPMHYPHMFNSPWASQEKIVENRQKLTKDIFKKRSTLSHAWVAAHAPLMHKEKLSLEEILAFKIQNSTTEQEKKRIMTIASDLKKTIGTFSSEDYKNGIVQLEAQEKMDLIVEAERSSIAFEQMSKRGQNVRASLTKVKEGFSTDWPRFWGYYGFTTYRELMHSVPDASTGKITFYQQVADLGPMPWIYAFDGDMADPSMPENLVYQADGFMGANPNFMVDNGLQLGGYAISFPADTFLSYNQGVKLDPEAASKIIEQKLIQGGASEKEVKKMLNQSMSFGRTFGTLLKSAFSFDQIKYGKWIVRKFFARFKAFQAFTLIGVTMTMVALYMGAEPGTHAFDWTFTEGLSKGMEGATPDVAKNVFSSRLWQAFLARQWGTAMGFWYYAWPWIPIVATSITLQNKLALLKQAHNNLVAKLAIAVDSKNSVMVRKQVQELDSFYKKHSRDLALEKFDQASILKQGEEVFRYASTNPEFIQSGSNKVFLLLNLVGSYATTVLGSTMNAPYMAEKTFAMVAGDFGVSLIGHLLLAAVLDNVLGGKFIMPYIHQGINFVESNVEKLYVGTGKAIVKTKQKVKGACNKLWAGLMLRQP